MHSSVVRWVAVLLTHSGLSMGQAQQAHQGPTSLPSARVERVGGSLRVATAQSGHPIVHPAQLPQVDFSTFDQRISKLAELNLRVDFELSADQKKQIHEIRKRADFSLAEWQREHDEDLAALYDEIGLMYQEIEGGNVGAIGRYGELCEQRRSILSSAPDPAPFAAELAAVLTLAQSKVLEEHVAADQARLTSILTGPATRPAERRR